VSDHLWYFPDVLPTVAEITGATAPPDIDGISITPTLFGSKATGREQKNHKYLYWEIGNQTAVRMQNWKAIQPGKNKSWELYDLGNDLGEQTDLADKHPDILSTMRSYAREAHTPVVEGTFHDTVNHEKDRRAKWGNIKPPPRKRQGKVNRLPAKGLLSKQAWKIVHLSSENRANNKTASNAIDGDPRTLWHSQFAPDIKKHPHELVVDLGTEQEFNAIGYLSRQDEGWNGTLADVEFSLSNSVGNVGEPISKTTFKKTKAVQFVSLPTAKGRYLRIKVLSEVNDGPWASIAEIGLYNK